MRKFNINGSFAIEELLINPIRNWLPIQLTSGLRTTRGVDGSITRSGGAPFFAPRRKHILACTARAKRVRSDQWLPRKHVCELGLHNLGRWMRLTPRFPKTLWVIMEIKVSWGLWCVSYPSPRSKLCADLVGEVRKVIHVPT